MGPGPAPPPSPEGPLNPLPAGLLGEGGWGLPGSDQGRFAHFSGIRAASSCSPGPRHKETNKHSAQFLIFPDAH